MVILVQSEHPEAIHDVEPSRRRRLWAMRHAFAPTAQHLRSVEVGAVWHGSARRSKGVKVAETTQLRVPLIDLQASIRIQPISRTPNAML